jgi:hypothetical protein
MHGSIVTESEIGSSLDYESNSLIVINQTEYTWYGDFIVNAGDTVVVENCIFTVVNGGITVYGTMEIGNSTIWMCHACSKVKTVYVYGNFTMFRSQILNENGRLVGCGGSHVFVLNSSSPTTVCRSHHGSDIEVHNSVLCGINSHGGKVFLLNATLLYTLLRLADYGESFVALDSHILSLWLYLRYEGDLEIRPGLVENLTIYSQSYSANFTLVNSYVTAWTIYSVDFSGKFSNSIIDTLRLTIDPEWTGNLTVTPGYVEYQEMACTKTPVIVENSTVNKWEILDEEGIFQILDSKIARVLISGHSEISIKNSEVQILAIEDSFGGSGGSLLTENSTISIANILLPTGISLDLSLKEGFNDFFNLYIPEYGSNMTIVKSTVDNWDICVTDASSLVLSNSTLTESSYLCNLEVLEGGSCLAYHSSLACVYCSRANLTLVNSTVNTLYAYGDSTVTAVNSTINMLITDPIQVELINSTILIDLDFSFEMTSEDAVTSTSSEEYDPLLPESIQRFSQYINITTRYNDYFEAQVRIHYNETKVEEAGINESRLRMYCLDKLGIWQLSPIQGVDTIENYVWTNVTQFSCFVLGSSPRHDISVTNVLSSKTIVGQGYNMSISIMTFNYGNHTENINITIYANTTIIGEINNIELSSGNFTIVQYTWNTTGFAKGNYTIWAYAWPVPGEIDTADNSLTDGWAVITIIGDINGDFKVDIKDLVLVIKHFASYPIHPLWNPDADVNSDGKVDIKDLVLVIKHFGEHYP